MLPLRLDAGSFPLRRAALGARTGDGDVQIDVDEVRRLVLGDSRIATAC